jgi:hypothetical protein
MNQATSKPMKHRVSLLLFLTATVLAAEGQMTNAVLPSAESLQTKILKNRYDWSKTCTNLTVEKTCPPWGCRPSWGGGSGVRVISDAEFAHIKVLERIHETDAPRLPARPTLTDSFSVALPPAIKPFRTAR